MSDTRTRVLDAALASLASNGFSGTTARAIAQIGGFAPGVIYYHFADLDDLLLAALTYSSESRAQRYRLELSGVDKAATAVEVLRRLYDEDAAVGHRCTGGGITLTSWNTGSAAALCLQFDPDTPCDGYVFERH